MEYIKAIIGQREMFVPVNEKLGQMIMLADNRLNYKRYLAKKRNIYKGTIETNAVRMCSEFVFVLEDVMEEQGHHEVFHLLIMEYPKDESKFYQELFREDKTFRFLC